jgi:hypothetical protein
MAEYKVLELIRPDRDGSPRYRSVREWTQPGDEPFSFCPHAHKVHKEAEQCRDFGRSE